MADDKYWEPTIKVFSSLFQKPKMSDKLLQKPPFKYLFDIVIATTQATQFGEGFFSAQELDPAFYESRDQKIMFLRKVIDLTQFAIGKGLAAKPNKIVAGLEPENTNGFLQEYYRAATTPELNKKGPKIIKKLIQKYEDEAKGGEGAAEAPAKEAPTVPAASESKPKPSAAAPTKPTAPPAKQEAPSKGGHVDEPVAVTKMVRPPSASTSAKAPPKIQSGLVKVQDNANKGKGTSGVIQDRGNSNDDDDHHNDQNTSNTAAAPSAKLGSSNAKGASKFVNEARNDGLVPEASNETAKNNEDEPKQGGGIKMTLRGANKKLTNSGTSGTGSAAASSSAGGGAAGASNLSGGSSANDIQALTLLVQDIAKNANPLGKSLEFISDDIESMNHELDYWTKQYKQFKEKLQVELKASDEMLQPLQDQIAEIDEKISDQKNKVQNVKAQLIKNASQIQTLLYSVVSTK